MCCVRFVNSKINFNALSDYYKELIKLLLKFGIDTNIVDVENKTASDYLTLRTIRDRNSEFCELLKFIFQYNPDTTIIDVYNKTAEDYLSEPEPEIKALFIIDCTYFKIELE